MNKDYSILGKEVAPASVTKELRLLWEADDASTKASLINFVIYSEEKDSIFANCDAVTEITREHACRAMLMELDREDKKPELRSWINAHCNLSGGTKSVCCEQISFVIDGYTPGIVRNTLFAHLDSDLPLVLWWQGELSLSFRESFYSKLDRLIIDSADWDDPSMEYQKVFQALEETKTLVVQDLAWTRTFQVRIAIAALADHPLVMQRIPMLKAVKVVSAGKYRTSGLQLLAWIAEIMSLEKSDELVDVEGDCFTMTRREGGEVKMELVENASYIGVGIAELDFGEVKLYVEAEDDRGLLLQKIIFNGVDMVTGHIPADKSTAVGLISSQLSRGGKNSLFKRILPKFAQFLK